MPASEVLAFIQSRSRKLKPDDNRGVSDMLVRAIMDSNQKCDGVLRSERTRDQNGLPAWKAWCRDGSSHIVAFTTDGTAQVLSPVQQN